MLLFLSSGIPIETKTMAKCMHAFDLYREREPYHPARTLHPICIHKFTGCFRRFLEEMEQKHNAVDQIFRSATELHEAGIWFENSNTPSLQDISFAHGLLRLPIMAFERLHVGVGSEEMIQLRTMSCVKFYLEKCYFYIMS